MPLPRISSAAPALAALFAATLVTASLAPRATPEPLPIVGAWDVTVSGPDWQHPGWLEIRETAHGLAARYTGAYGSPSDVGFVAWDGETFEMRVAPGQRWRGRFNGRWFEGTTGAEGETWTAVRAPKLPATAVRWGKPVTLFDGRTLAGWRPRHAGSDHGWTVRDGVLANLFPGDDLVTRERWMDFRLSLRFRLQPGSDSGIHLRGRYEIQLNDRRDDAGSTGVLGAIYGQLAPSQSVSCPAGQWNSLEVTLLGREVTVVLNGVTILEHATIPGITGDALDSREGTPGPLMLQGYLGSVEFRDLVLTPAL